MFLSVLDEGKDIFAQINTAKTDFSVEPSTPFKEDFPGGPILANLTAELQIRAGQWTISSQNWVLSGQILG